MPQVDSDKLTLAIEMSNPAMWADPLIAGEVIVGRVGPDGVAPLGADPITQQSPRDDALAPTIDRLLRRLDIEPKQLDCIAVSAGPGGFTSARIAVTSAKVIAEAAGARVVIVPTGEIVARTIRRARDIPGDLAVTLAGKRDSAWCAVYGPCRWDAGPWSAPAIAGVMEVEQFAAAAKSARITTLVADAHVPGGFLDWARRHSVDVMQPGLGAEAVLVASCFHEAVDPVDAAPIYPREPEAVTKWRDLSGASG